MKKTWPVYDDDEIQIASEILRSGKVNYWTGEHGKLFEKEYAEYLGVPYTIVVANGTLALELCLRALGIGPNDEVIIPSRTFIATASCVVTVGAKPVIADVDLISQNIAPNTILPHITSRTKAIIAVHLGGWPCDMPAIMLLAKQYNLFVIEDCAQAHGAKINGKPVGSFGDMAAFSFCQDKIISTAGEGGLVACTNKVWWEMMWAYKDHGKSYDTVYNKQHPPGFRWLHDSFGSNYRMTEIQAAVGRIQLKKLDGWVKLRQQYANYLYRQFQKLPALIVAMPSNEVNHAYYRYYFFVKPAALKKEWSRDRMVYEITQRGVACFVGSCSEIYLERAFQRLGTLSTERFPNAKLLGETSLAVLVDPALTEKEIVSTAEVVSHVVHEASVRSDVFI